MTRLREAQIHHGLLWHAMRCGQMADMKRDPFLRWGWLIALASGLTWILSISLGRLSPDPDSWNCNSSWDYVLNAIEPVAFFLTAAAIWALYAGQRQHTSARYLRWAAAAGAAGAIGAGINNPIEHCADIEMMSLVLWVPAVTLWVLGLLLIGGLTLADRVLPAWAGVAVLIGLAGLLAAGEEPGFIIHGMAWFVVSLALWRSRPTAQKSRARPDDRRVR